MSHVDPKRPTVMPAYPLGSPPGAETADPDEDPQTAHPPPRPPPPAQPEYEIARPRPRGDDEWTVQPENDVSRR